ncbi:MAG TPA: glycoside hydrolase family 16 protein [Noviherbaspirillum sp.]|nr:glycoside hydrolase family 16 protein [Noviherbaspirillum sp.]
MPMRSVGKPIRILTAVLVLCAGAVAVVSACRAEGWLREHRVPAEGPPRSPATPFAARLPYGQDPDGWVLTFSEEFERFDRSVWNDHIWYEKSNPTINYAVEDGLLKIWPQRDATGQFFNRTIDTDGKFYQTYGYFEMEAKLPRGKGTWPAFWLFNHIGDRRPEIDIMEAYPGGVAPWGYTDRDGVRRPTAYGVTVWFDEDIKAGGLQYDVKRDLSRGFHKYAVKWEPEKQTFYFDGKKVYEVNARMPDPKYIVLDLWFGSSSGEPDHTTPQGKSNSFEINYVRAWQFRPDTGKAPHDTKPRGEVPHDAKPGGKEPRGKKD